MTMMMTATVTINKVRNIKANLDRGVAMRHHLLITLAPEVNNFAHQRNLLQNVYYYCSYQKELEFLKSDWS